MMLRSVASLMNTHDDDSLSRLWALKNGWTDRDVVWVVGYEGSYARMGSAIVGGKGADIPPGVAQKGLNRSRMLSRVCGRREPCIRLGADAPTGRGSFIGVYSLLQSIGFWDLGKRVSCAKTVGPILTVYTSYMTWFCARKCHLRISITLLTSYGA